LEDDPEQAQVTELWLTEAGHSCSWAETGQAFKRQVRNSSFDLLIIDWMLPDTSGEEVLVWTREFIDQQVPILFVTRRDREEDIVRALEQGADDYMVKPVKRLELLARIHALGRRSQQSVRESHVLQFGALQIDTVERSVLCNGEAIALTPKEFELALFLFSNPGRLLSRGHILESVWGRRPDLNTRTVDTHISKLRRKLGLDTDQSCRLTAIYHHGYRLECPSGGPA
jgi:DNA-binding response OmpR family regulator